jgi:hypothetical protein
VKAYSPSPAAMPGRISPYLSQKYAKKFAFFLILWKNNVY